MTTLHIKLCCFHITLLSLLTFFSICGGSTELDSSPPPITHVGCVELERQALLRIKAAFTNPYNILSSWTGLDCCSSWAGVACSNVTGHVEKLDLRDAYLIGDLSSSLTDLKYLTYLDLSYNNFQNKTIPEFIGLMERLVYLDMSCSSFGGVIPRQLGNLRNLVELRLVGCASVYHISELRWVSSLFSLERLEIESVNLSLASQQWLQSVNMLPNLKSLALRNCELAYLPQTLPFVNLTSLTHLDLSYNNFNTLVPTWLSNASSLADIEITGSGLIGRIPGLAFENMCNLQRIGLVDNYLDGGLVDLVDTLVDCCNSSMQGLDLRHNKLGDYLPDTLGRFRNIEVLYLYSNLLFGSIPASIGNLTKLRALDICENQWQGVMRDAHLSNLVNLTYLCIGSSDKSLVLDFSADWCPPFNLSYLRISDCQIGASFPAWIESQTNLNRLILSKTAISGVVPDWIWKLSTQLLHFDLSENKLHGNLPEMLTIKGPWGILDLGNNLFEGTLPRLQLSNLSKLSLKNNRLSGVMPTDMFDEQPPDLQILDLSGNMLSGNIPTKLDAMKALMYVDFSSNNLSGEVPEILCLLPSLSWLKLRNNSLFGEPCNSVTAFRWLKSIDLGENNFLGNIPKWRGDSLEEIRLHGNFFKGSLPAELCSLPNLHVLDLARNKLSGQISPCFGKMTGFSKPRKLLFSNFHIGVNVRRPNGIEMELSMKGSDLIFDTNLPLLNLIDLSGNQLSGQISEQITNLSYLNCLNLSGNKINGHIPDNIGLLQNLESLDLSNNALDGHIPASLASITFLSKLNLSHNNLSGQIPLQNQFQTFDPSIYEGNPYLCGMPLPTMCNPQKLDKDSSDESGISEKMTPDFSERMMLWASIVLGFIFGFWAVCGTLALKKSWRDAYFRFLGIR